MRYLYKGLPLLGKSDRKVTKILFCFKVYTLTVEISYAIVFLEQRIFLIMVYFLNKIPRVSYFQGFCFFIGYESIAFLDNKNFEFMHVPNFP